MWLGIIIGLLLGGAFGSFQTALFMAAIGAVLGRVWAARSEQPADGLTLEDLQCRIELLEAELELSNQRLAQLESVVGAGDKHVASAAAAAAGLAAVPLAAQASAPVVEKAPPQDPPEPVRQKPAPLTRPAVVDVPVAASIVPPQAPQPAVVAKEMPAAVPPPVSVRRQAPPAWEEQKEPARSVELEEVSVFPEWFSRWVIGGNPIVKVGVLILFLGLAFLLRYVAENTVVPISLRYAAVAASGIGLLLAGWRWRDKADSYGLILQGAGIAVLYLTTLAGMKLHPLLPAALGFVVLAGVAAFSALLAVLEDALALAVVAALGGFAAPVLASTGSEHHLAFFSYLLVMNLGIAAIAWFKAWRILNLIGFAATFALATAWGQQHYQPGLFALAETFLLFFLVLYILIAFLFARRRLSEALIDGNGDGDGGLAAQLRQAVPHVDYVDGSLVFGVPIAAFGLQYLISRSFENGPAFSALGFGLLYIVLAYGLFRRSGLRYALLSETMIALAVIFGSLSLPLGLEGEWTSAGWAVEAAGVYWVGARQQRPHARLFALLLLFGSAVYFLLDVRPGDAAHVFNGSLLGCLMLSTALVWTWRLSRQLAEDELHAWERGLQSWLLIAASIFLALAPFLLWPMNWAATALTLMGAAVLLLARRVAEPRLIDWGCLFQLLGGVLFLTTLQPAGGGAVLADGWQGLLAALLIGGTMLLGVRAVAENSAVDGENKGKTSWLLLAGLLFINLAPLFVLNWRHTAMLWPFSAVLTLWWAVRSGRTSALAFALGLQLLTGFIVFDAHGAWFASLPAEASASAFLHAGFWSPVLIALAALLGARLLQRRDSRAGEVTLGWGSLLWAAAWWALAWRTEVQRLLPEDSALQALLAVTVLTAAACQWLARRCDWRQIGQATLAYLPLLAGLLLAQWQAGAARPLVSWSLLLWPLALLVHGRLLRAYEQCLGAGWRPLVHVCGAWFFIVLATLEVHAHVAGWGDGGSVWSWLGYLPAALLFLVGLNSLRLGERWPLRDYREAYALIAAAPLVLLLLAWVGYGNVLDGAARPLPYLPVLNPLELGQIIVLVVIARWWAELREHPLLAGSEVLLAGVLGLSAFALLSSLVLRTCHHWGGVRWQAEALASSLLAQAALSIVWSLLAIVLMLLAHRHVWRRVWLLGAALIALVVGKLFLVELAASGSLERIVSFIVVGLLLLLVGYFAPLPPRSAEEGR